MATIKKYVFNPKTLSYEVKKRSRGSRALRTVTMFVMSLGMAVLYFWLYTGVFGMELPKTILLKKTNAQWHSKVEVLNRQLDGYDKALTSLQMRDDGKLTEEDRVIMTKDPDWIGSIATSLSYKGFDLSADLYISYGGTKYNSYLTSYDTGGDLTGKRNGLRRNYWTTNNPSNEAPSPNLTQAPAYINALGYQDADFIRLRNVTFGYTFPQSMIRRILLQNLRIYVSCTNLWSYTEVLGYGPEQTPGDYPEPRTVLLGLKLTF